MSSQPRTTRRRTWIWNVLGGITLSLITFQMIPTPQFNVPYSTLYYSPDGELVDATLADDDRFRFPPDRNVPPKYHEALLTHLDEGFHTHPGVEPMLLAQALIEPDNRSPQACTLTQHVVRLARNRAPRTFKAHLVEGLIALKLEQANTKENILRLYASHAPFGSNIIGIEAASWYYFAHTSEDLSWAEAATLAVLPTAPSTPSEAELTEHVIEARNDLLHNLHTQGTISTMTYSMAVGERLVATLHDLNATQGTAKPGT